MAVWAGCVGRREVWVWLFVHAPALDVSGFASSGRRRKGGEGGNAYLCVRVYIGNAFSEQERLLCWRRIYLEEEELEFSCSNLVVY